MNNNIRSIFFLLIFSIFKNITKEIDVGPGVYFIIDTGSEMYASIIDLTNFDVKNRDFIFDLLKNDEYRKNLKRITNNKITDTLYTVNKDIKYYLCSCNSKERNLEGKYKDLSFEKNDENLIKQIYDNQFNYDDTKFYYFSILNKDNFDKLYNIKFTNVEVFNKNLEYKEDDTDLKPNVYTSKTSCTLKDYDNKMTLEDNIKKSIKDCFKDFCFSVYNLQKEIYYSKSVKVVRLLGYDFSKIKDIINTINSGEKSENTLSLEIIYKDEADVKLEFICLDGYTLNIKDDEKTVHFNIKNDFATDKSIDNKKKTTISDVININTVGKKLENKEFDINGKKVKLPPTCYKIEEDRENFNNFKVIITLPNDDKVTDRDTLLSNFLTKIPEKKIVEEQKKNCSGYKKNTNKLT